MKLFGITVNENEKRNWKDFLNVEYEIDDKIIFVSKETFHIEKNNCEMESMILIIILFWK